MAFHTHRRASPKHRKCPKLCLKILLGSEYSGYDQALEACGLERLSVRRQQKCLNFGLKSLLHPVHAKMFPINPQLDSHDTRNQEHFTVNWAGSESYGESAIPYIQRMLNEYVKNQNKNTNK